MSSSQPGTRQQQAPVILLLFSKGGVSYGGFQGIIKAHVPVESLAHVRGATLPPYLCKCDLVCGCNWVCSTLKAAGVMKLL